MLKSCLVIKIYVKNEACIIEIVTPKFKFYLQMSKPGQLTIWIGHQFIKIIIIIVIIISSCIVLEYN